MSFDLMYIRKVLEQTFDWLENAADGGVIILKEEKLLIEIDRFGSFKNTEKKQTGREWIRQWIEQGYFRRRNGDNIERCIDIDKPYHWFDKKQMINQKKLELNNSMERR